jgi:hypothetical protein
MCAGLFTEWASGFVFTTQHCLVSQIWYSENYVRRYSFTDVFGTSIPVPKEDANPNPGSIIGRQNSRAMFAGTG